MRKKKRRKNQLHKISLALVSCSLLSPLNQVKKKLRFSFVLASARTHTDLHVSLIFYIGVVDDHTGELVICLLIKLLFFNFSCVFEVIK